MIMTSVIDRLLRERDDLIQFLEHNDQPSFRVAADAVLLKTLMLSAASYFELRITAAIKMHTRAVPEQSASVLGLIESKAIKRQYHTFFDWDANNANRFFSLFGSDCKQWLKNQVANDAELARGIRAFLEIGQLRNEMVHEDFGTYELNKTAREIKQLYDEALIFVDQIPRLLVECDEQVVGIE